MKYIYLLLAILLVSCSEGKKDANPPKNPDSKQTDTTKKNHLKKIAGGDAYEAGGEEKDKLQNSLDSIKMTIGWWNEAINAEAVIMISELYYDDVQYYREKVKGSDLAFRKRVWLQAHPGYSQTIEITEIQYPAEAEGTIRCLFDKTFTLNNKEQTVKSILELKLIPGRINGRYEITKESDVPTELSLINDETPMSLPKGDYEFQHDYWLDTRDSDVIGHEFVPYYASVSIHVGDSLVVGYGSYSGMLRESRQYVTKDAVMKDGFLSFKAAPIFGDAFGEEEEGATYEEEDYHFYKFKIFDKNIALVETNSWFEEWIGTRFW